MTEQKNTTSIHLVITQLPQLSNGEILPKSIKDFKNHCWNYFVNAKGGIEDNLKVSHILGCFENNLVNDWISVNREQFTTLTLLVATWLGTNHTFQNTERSLISEETEVWRMDSIHPVSQHLPLWYTLAFRRWSYSSSTWSWSWWRSPGTRDAKAHNVLGLHPWITAIKDLDNHRITQRKHVTEAVKEAMKSNKKPFTSSSRYANTSDMNTVQTNTPNTASFSTWDFPPKLTNEEHRLLMEHAGCLKCRKFYAGHRAHQCTTTISGKNYKVLTPQDAQWARAIYNSRTTSNQQINTVATVSDPTLSTLTNDFVAAIFPSLSSNIVGDGSFSDGSDNSYASVSSPPHIKSRHLIWNCLLTGPLVDFPVTKPSLINNGCHMVLICPDIIAELGLPIFNLHEPEQVDVAISFSKAGIEWKKHLLVQYCKVCPFSSDSIFHSRLVHTVICPGLCMPIIFGLPFLEINDIICDHKWQACIVQDKKLNYNLLAPVKRQQPPQLKMKLRKQLLLNKSHKKETLQELTKVFPEKWKDRILEDILDAKPNYIASILHCINTLEIEASMTNMERNLLKSFKKVFEPSHTLTTFHYNPLVWITLKDAEKTIKTRNYPCPRKWKEAWYVLLQQHLDAGQIQPSHVPTGLVAFLIPKADPTILPRWVNDYRQLNENTVTDSFPIPRINDILADCAKGKIWATLDMTISFFQMRMHPDDIPLTAVNTPWGLYEWLVMPMGIKNAPSIHQQRVTAALWPYIGRICHFI